MKSEPCGEYMCGLVKGGLCRPASNVGEQYRAAVDSIDTNRTPREKAEGHYTNARREAEEARLVCADPAQIDRALAEYPKELP